MKLGSLYAARRNKSSLAVAVAAAMASMNKTEKKLVYNVSFEAKDNNEALFTASSIEIERDESSDLALLFNTDNTSLWTIKAVL